MFLELKTDYYNENLLSQRQWPLYVRSTSKRLQQICWCTNVDDDQVLPDRVLQQ
jgi:hypothetical protein